MVVGYVVVTPPGGAANPSIAALIQDLHEATGTMVHLEELRSFRCGVQPWSRGVLLGLTYLHTGRISTVRAAILSKDVIPGMGVPVAAPGLRTWGMALGLRALGHEVTILIDHWLVSTVWRGTVPPPMPPGSGVMQIKRVGDYVRAHGVDAVVITNSTKVVEVG